MKWLWLLLGAGVVGCERPRPPAPAAPTLVDAQPVAARVTRAGGRVIIAAIPTAGTRINALLPPELELPSGTIAHLTGPALTTDSTYFAGPPEVSLPDSTSLEGARLRLSICDSGAAFCRVIMVRL